MKSGKFLNRTGVYLGDNFGLNPFEVREVSKLINVVSNASGKGLNPFEVREVSKLSKNHASDIKSEVLIPLKSGKFLNLLTKTLRTS